MKAMMLTLTMVGGMASVPAHAGKLAEGFRGVPWGDAAPLVEPPAEGCARDPEPGIKWRCPITVGGVPVVAAWAVEHSLFNAVVVSVEGFNEADKLFNVLQAAYGKGRKENEYQSGSLPDWRWRDGVVTAGWSYNRFSEQGTLVLLHLDHVRDVRQRNKDKAAESAGDL